MTKKKIPIQVIKKIEAELSALPPRPPENVNKTEAVHMLAPLIARMQLKGYSLDTIAALLSERGLFVSRVVLKTYLKRGRGRAKGGKSALLATRLPKPKEPGILEPRPRPA